MSAPADQLPSTRLCASVSRSTLIESARETRSSSARKHRNAGDAPRAHSPGTRRARLRLRIRLMPARSVDGRAGVHGGHHVADGRHHAHRERRRRRRLLAPAARLGPHGRRELALPEQPQMQGMPPVCCLLRVHLRVHYEYYRSTSRSNLSPNLQSLIPNSRQPSVQSRSNQGSLISLIIVVFPNRQQIISDCQARN